MDIEASWKVVKMQTSCPLCLGTLRNLNVNDEARSSWYCQDCYDESVCIARFSCSYKKTNEELIYYTLYLDAYCIENTYDLNKTKISMREKDVPHVQYKNILFLPLIHFEIDNLAKIRQKLKLLLTFM